jgi:lambda repressor-like predicted transcriptional regulator
VVRQYKRKRNPRGRMLRAVELRADGKSLREIAKEVGCSYQTVANDLAQWQSEHENVVALSNPPVKKMPHGGENLTPDFDSTASVIPLRRAK